MRLCSSLSIVKMYIFREIGKDLSFHFLVTTKFFFLKKKKIKNLCFSEFFHFLKFEKYFLSELPKNPGGVFVFFLLFVFVFAGNWVLEIGSWALGAGNWKVETGN